MTVRDAGWRLSGSGRLVDLIVSMTKLVICGQARGVRALLMMTPILGPPEAMAWFGS